MRRTPLACRRSSRKSAVVSPIGPPSESTISDYDISLSVEVPPFLRRQTFLRRTAGAAHRHALRLDGHAWVGRAVRLVLKPAARVALALERFGVALLLVGAVVLAFLLPASEHGPRLTRVSRSEPSATLARVRHGPFV